MNDYENWINQEPLTTVDSGPLHFAWSFAQLSYQVSAYY